MRTPEGHEKHDVRQFLASVGAYSHWPTTFGMGRNTNDGLVCLRGHFWLVEVKREGKAPTPPQHELGQRVFAAGGRVAWGTASMIIPELEDFLRSLGP
jgi:hypothetical protein